MSNQLHCKNRTLTLHIKTLKYTRWWFFFIFLVNNSPYPPTPFISMQQSAFAHGGFPMSNPMPRCFLKPPSVPSVLESLIMELLPLRSTYWYGKCMAKQQAISNFWQCETSTIFVNIISENYFYINWKWAQKTSSHPADFILSYINWIAVALHSLTSFIGWC